MWRISEFCDENSYARHLEQTHDFLSPQLASKLVGERSSFVGAVVQTRNYLTHLGIKKGTKVVDGGKALFLLNQRIHAFLSCVMLVDLGLTEDDIKEAVLRRAQRWS
jgi:ApeA N-terminal domain 1